MKIYPTKWLLLLVSWLGYLGALAQSKPGITRTYAITNATVVVKPGQTMTNTTVIVKNGVITEVGVKPKIPANAKVIKGDSMYVYAGFILGMSHLGTPKPEEKEINRSEIKPGNAPDEVAGITPQRTAATQFSAKDKNLADWRALGFTTVQAAPQGRMLPGNTALFTLGQGAEKNMLVQDQAGLFFQLAGATRVFPNTTIGVLSKFEDLYRQATQQKTAEKAYATNPNGMTRPAADPVLKAFYPVIDKQQPVVFKASDAKAVYQGLAMQKQLGFNLVLVDVNQVWLVADAIKSANVPVMLTLKLPEAPKEEKKKDEAKKDEKENDKTPQEPQWLKDEKTAMEARRKSEMTNYENQAATLEKKGIPFAFSAMDANTKDIRKNLTRMIKAGLSENTALAALTTVPASMLGVSNAMGTIEKGKTANLFVSDKTCFDEKATIRYVLVDGSLFEYEAAKKDSTSAKDSEKLLGDWSFQIDIPNNAVNGILKWEIKDGELTGTSTVESESNPVKELTIKGEKISFSVPGEVNGMSLVAKFSATLSPDNMQGSMTIDGMGTFPFTAKRTATPKQ